MNNLFIKNNTLKQSVIIQINQISNVAITNSFFSQNQIQSCILSSNGDQIVIKNTNFTNNKSYGSGTGFNLNNFNLTNSNLMIDCHFSENISQDEGGAILLQNVDIDIQNSSFLNNTSSIGGAIRYKEYIPSFVKNIKSTRNLQSQKSIIFKGNRAKIFGQNIGSYPYKIVLKEDLSRDLEQYVFENYRSGDNNFSIKLILLDEEYNPVKVSSKDIGYSLKIQNEIKTYQLQLISLNLTELEIKDNTQFQYIQSGQDYLFNLKGMQLLGTPSKKVKFEIQAFFMQKISGNQILIGQKIYDVYVSFRKCEVGEIYVKISDTKYECSPCGDKFYSLQNPIKDSNQACKSCPEEGAVSCINSKIILQSGYWRNNNFSDIIIKCANRPENCHGKEQDGFCVEGYIGPLCEVCDSYGVVWGKKYGYLGNYLCNQCNQPASIILKQLIHFLLISAYLIYSIQKSIDVASKQIICQTLRRLNVIIIGKTGEKDQISFYIKLFINYVQVTSIIQNSIFKFFDITFIDISSIFGSPSSYLSNSLDCFFSQTNILPIEYLRGIWVSIQPFFYILVAIVLFTLSTYIFGFIAFQCNTATQLVLIMSCSQIGDVYYIKSQLNKECYTQEHLKYTLYFILPLFLFWVIIITLFILWRIRIKRNKLTEPIQLYKYGFICGDYKTEYFYWEFLRILLRLSIVL
ncbi:transmembrane protein, putative, partial (macronuclear) [Tetrahymena thermophila SB210]